MTLYLPHSFFLQKEQKGTSTHASHKLNALDLQRKINSNFTPTGCVAQLCQNTGIIREEGDVARGDKESATSLCWAELVGAGRRHRAACPVSFLHGSGFPLLPLDIAITVMAHMSLQAHSAGTAFQDLMPEI